MTHTSRCPSSDHLGGLQTIVTRKDEGPAYIELIPTWMVFELTGLPSVETTMGEYLQPDIVIFDVRQRRQVFLRNVRSTFTTKDFLSNLAYDREAADKTHRRAVPMKVEGVLVESGEASRGGPGHISEIRIRALGGRDP